MARAHDDQVDVGVDVVRRLIAAQFPRWTDLPVLALRGPATVNAAFRLGDALVARFPLRPAAADRVESEVRAARELLGVTRFPTPEPVALGVAGEGYPFPWSVLRWIPGTPADEVDTAGSSGLARDLAEFVRGVRELPLREHRFSGAGRGGDLHRHDAWMAECFERSAGLLDVARLRDLWARFRGLPHVAADVVVHGDLVPGNLLVPGQGDATRLAGVLDVGGSGPADPALDLICAWHLFGPGAREEFRRSVGCDDLDWARGQAWAFQQSMGLVWYYVTTNPRMSELGRSTLRRIVDDPVL